MELSDQRDVLGGCHKRAYKIENVWLKSKHYRAAV
jgi:hypothetical protein